MKNYDKHMSIQEHIDDFIKCGYPVPEYLYKQLNQKIPICPECGSKIDWDYRCNQQRCKCGYQIQYGNSKRNY